MTERSRRWRRWDGLALALMLGLAARALGAPAGTNNPAVQSVVSDVRHLSARPGGELHLWPSPKNVFFNFGTSNGGPQTPLRVRCRLEGFEQEWHEGGGFMLLAIRFVNSAGDQIEQKSFPVSGESPGWNGSLKTSVLTHRRETLVVPPGATHASVVISSAGPPAAVGVYVVANLVMTAAPENGPATVLIASPFDRQPKVDFDKTPAGWIRDGTHMSMAKIMPIGFEPAIGAFVIEDDDYGGHAEWRTIHAAPTVSPGERLVVEWNEMFSIGTGDFKWVVYPELPAGVFRFHIVGVDLLGKPDGYETSLKVFVPQPLWKRPWFLGTMLVFVTAVLAGGGRYVAWRRMQREMTRLKNQQALERERLRIANDIHDDLGARVTQISMASAMLLGDTTLSDKSRTEVDQIRQMSRDLISALYETVWVVNPDYDNLDALGNYLCQMVNQLCKQTTFHCRLHVSELSGEIQVSSQMRHNISMAVKEAVHNAIKHSGVAEAALHISFQNHLLSILIQDQGCGFPPRAHPAGHGLTNMERRMKDIGGSCSVASQPGGGTTVQLKLVISPPAYGPEDKNLN